MSGERERIIFLVTGAKGSGKSTLLRQLVDSPLNHDLLFDGIIAPRAGVQDNLYKVCFIASGLTMDIASRGYRDGWLEFGRYFFNPEAFDKGCIYLAEVAGKRINTIIIDEIGPVELGGHGWAGPLKMILEGSPVPLVLSVRTALVEQIVKYFSIKNPILIEAGEESPEEVGAMILPHTRRFKSGNN
jgi:iron complex transport system ATP-binding protein